MIQAFASIGLVTLLSAVAFGQTAPRLPTFEAADVHVTRSRLYTKYRSDAYLSSGFVAGRYQLHTANMADLIRTAYDMDLPDYLHAGSDTLFGGPTWLDTERFEIIAKAPPNTSQADLRLMLRALLADRFKLVVHKAEKPIDVFALTASKRVLMKESEAPGEMNCKPVPPNGPYRYVELSCHNVKMADFVKEFRETAWYVISHNMVDLTGLKGSYDFTLKWTAWGMVPPSGGEADANPYISFFDAVERQLGLKLTKQKHPMPVLVIDSVNRTPTENVPGVEKIVGTVTEFELASVRPTGPEERNRRFRNLPGGRLEVVNMPLKSLIAFAWNMEDEENLILEGPKWIDSSNFDIVAKAGGPPSPEPIPMEAFRVMLQALLKERFKLAVHTEDKPVAVWTLVVGRRGAKMEKGDPTGRSGCLWQAGEQKAGTFGAPTANLVCRNVSMEQLADSLHATARSYVDHPAVDKTGLKGVYNFTLTFMQQWVFEGMRRQNQAAAGTSAGASDPIPAITIFDALDKIGLRLDSGQKRPQPVLVIDHIETLPSGN